jgi:hypothetical protein
MQCPNCKTELPPNSKFCSQCGTAVPGDANLQVQQDIGIVKGSVTGAVLGEGMLPAGLNVAASQKVDTVEAGGTVVGAVVGEHAQLSGQRQYGDVVHGDKIGGGEITVGNITDSTGIAIGNSAQSTVTHIGASKDEIAKAFAPILEKVNALQDGPDKGVAQSAVKALETEARKGDQADEKTVSKWLGFLAETAADAWKVAINTLANPIMGVGKVFQLIAAKAKEGRMKKEPKE